MIEAATISPECFEKRCVELYAMFGELVQTFDELPDSFKEFVTMIGYVRVCSLMVVYDLDKGRSEWQLARKYNLTRRQIQGIKENSRKRTRANLYQNGTTMVHNTAL